MSGSRRVRKKGQIEFIAVIILVAIGVATVSYAAFTSSPELFFGSQEAKTAKDTIMNFISEAGYMTLKEMSLYGGYLEPQTHYVLYTPQQGIPVVNYYYYGGENYYPTTEEMENNLAIGVATYLSRYKDSVQDSLKNQGVVIENLETVKTKIYDNKVVLTVEMPATVDNQTIGQPFEVEIITRFGEIASIGKELVELNNADKYFETFTLAEMISDSTKTGKESVPIFIPPQFDCDPVYIGWNSMRQRVQDSITYVVGHTYLPEQIRGTGRKYLLPPIDEKNHNGLDISFDLPSSFRLGVDDFQFVTKPDGNLNQITIEPQRVGYTSERCTSTPLTVEYYVKYPVVVMIWDENTRNSFRFAFEVFNNGFDLESKLNSNSFTAVDFRTESDAIENKEVCEEMKCVAKITVKDITGELIPYASIKFGGCPLGETGEDGTFSGAAPCIMDKLEIGKAGYTNTYRVTSIDSLQTGQTFYLKERVKINLQVYEVDVTKSGDDYSISSSAVRLLSGEKAEIQFWTALGPEREIVIDKPAERVELTQGTLYTIGGFLRDNTKKEYMGGFAGAVAGASSDQTWYIYIPSIAGFQELRGEKMTTELERLTKLLRMDGCGIGSPVRTSPAKPTSCSYSTEELG